VEGTTISGADRAITVIVTEFSDEIKAALKDHFAAFCYGAVKASEDDAYYSFSRTVDVFLTNFDSKSKKTQLGMIGELFMHLLHPVTHSDLLSAAIYFNKEERNVKKGFDLSFLESEVDSIWYGEVKTGRVKKDQLAEAKSHDLLMLAARDLHDKLTTSQQSRWDSAIIDADLTLKSPQANTVKKLLRTDVIALEQATPITRRAFLGALTLHDHEHCHISEAGTARSATSITAGGKFHDVRILAIQHLDESDILTFLRDGLIG
jgi:hypothetical protein